MEQETQELTAAELQEWYYWEVLGLGDEEEECEVWDGVDFDYFD